MKLKNLPSFDSFINESRKKSLTKNKSINESYMEEILPELPYGSYDSEYGIDPKVIKDFYRSIQNALGNHFEISEDLSEMSPREKMNHPLYQEMNSYRDSWNARNEVFDWTDEGEGTTFRAFKLKNGDVGCAIFSTWGSFEPDDCLVWSITSTR